MVKVPPISVGAKQPDILYHYTGEAGLHGIVESQSFLAGNARYLNDFAEVDHGIRLVRSAVTSILAEKKEHPFATHLERAAKPTGFGLEEYDVYVFSLSEEKDLLSQWRAYSADTRGYALGFDRKALETLCANDPEETVAIIPVDYDTDGGANTARRTIQSVMNAYEELQRRAKAPAQEIGPVIEQHLAELLLSLPLAFKHDAFREEKEWRILYMRGHERPQEDLEFRARRGVLVPYVRLRPRTKEGTKDPLPMAAVGIGPGIDEAAAERSISLLLGRANLKPIKPYKSRIPYRT